MVSLGTRRHCHSCDGKFYDFSKTPIICPLCETEFDPEVLLKSRRAKLPTQREEEKAQTPAANPLPESDDIAADINADDDDVAADDVEVLADSEPIIPIASSGDEEDAVINNDTPIENDLDTIDSDAPDSADTADPVEEE